MRIHALRLTPLFAALLLMGCPAATKKCTSNTDCPTGQICSAAACVAGRTDGGTGGSSTGGGTGGGATGGGTGGGATGGGTGGGTTGGGTGGGSASGETCAAPSTLPTSGGTGDLTGMAKDYQWKSANGCKSTSSYADGGADSVYVVSIPANQRLSVTVTPSSNWDPVLNMVQGPAASACSAVAADGGFGTACIASADTGYKGDPETVNFTNTTAAPVSAFLVVSSYDEASGAYGLSSSVGPVPAGETCANATALTASLTRQSLAGFVDDYAGGPGCAYDTSGPDRVYKVTIPAGQRVTLVAAAEAADGGTSTVPNLNLVTGTCAPTLTCVASADDLSTPPNTVVYSNVTGAPLDVFVVADTLAGTLTGTFSLSVAFGTPPAGDTCGTATTLSGTLSGQSLSGFANDYQAGTGCATNTLGVDRVYKVSVPANQRVTVSAAAEGTDAGVTVPTVNLVTGTCSQSLTCVAGANDTSVPPNTALYTNVGSAAQDVYVVADTAGGTVPSGTFSITAAFSTPPAGDTCSTATTLSGTLTGQSLAGFANDYTDGTGCAYGTSGGDRAYKVSVPANQRATVTATGAALADGGTGSVPTLNLVVGACTPVLTCVGGASAFSSPTTATFTNASASAQDLYVVADTTASSPAGTFSLGVAFSAPPPGDLCSNAEAINTTTLPVTLSAQTTVGYSADIGASSSSATCTHYSTPGADRVYSLDVPNGKTLKATVTPTGTAWDPAIYVVAGPASNCLASNTQCLAGADVGTSGQPDTATYANTSGTTKSVFIVVDSFNSSGKGTFDLKIEML